VSARDKFEELDVQKRNADDDDTQHQHIILVKNKPNVSKKNAVEFHITKQFYTDCCGGVHRESRD
jgi:hypothetical protein